MDSNLGTFIRALRKENNLSLKELSKLSGISFSQIAKIERGEHIPSRKTTIKIAAALSYDQDKLLKLSGYIPAYFDTKDTSISPSDRYKAIIKFNCTCQICGEQAPTVPIEVTYINLLSKNNHIDNLIILCRNCHLAREHIIKQEGIEYDLLSKKEL